MLKNILVAVDKSVASHQAFETALELAKALGAQLTLVHALDVFAPSSPQRPQVSANSYSIELDTLVRGNYDRQWDEFVQHYDSLLKQQQETAAAIGVDCTYLQPYGRPGPAICRAAKDSQADLIVVGSHARKGLSEMLLGSVSNHVTHHAPCSVMVIHPHRSRAPTSGQESAKPTTAGSLA